MSRRTFLSKGYPRSIETQQQSRRLSQGTQAARSGFVHDRRGTMIVPNTEAIAALQTMVGNAIVGRLVSRPLDVAASENGVIRLLPKERMVALQADAGTPAASETEADKTEKRLNDNGITIHSSGGCRDRTKANCTSVDGIRKETIDGLIAFRKAVGVDLVMTGGTETGHASGTRSHSNGYKVDIALDSKVTKYIKDNFTDKGTRSDGAALYEDAEGNEFALESNHWDITIK